MTNKQYSKEELFLRELAQVCKKYATGLHKDKHLGIITVDIDNLDVVGIHIFANGEYCGLGDEETIKGKVE